MTVRVVVVGNSYGAYCQLPALRWAATRGGLDANACDANDAEAAPEVTAIVGRDLEKARATAERFSIPLATTSLDDALATLRRGEEAEQARSLVLVSTPVDLHAPMVREIFDTTRASIVCEKPFTLDVTSARSLAARAHELARTQPDGRIALVDHQLRWSAPRRRFKQLIDGGAAGTPWVARAEMCFGSMERLTRRASWWDQRDRGGGAMQAIASHLVDGLLWILGPVVDVQARLTMCTTHRLLEGAAGDAGEKRAVTADDHCELWLTHASGARSTVLCTTVQTHGRRSLLEVIGSRGVVRLVDEQELGHGRHDGPWTPVTDASARLASVADVDACNDSAFARSEPLFLRDVLRAVASRGGAASSRTSIEHAATFDDGAAVVQIMAASSRS